MAQIEVPEQRTPEWYQQRRKYITASEAAYAMSLCGEYQMQNTIFKKLGIYMSSGTGDACIHGILLESATRPSLFRFADHFVCPCLLFLVYC